MTRQRTRDQGRVGGLRLLAAGALATLALASFSAAAQDATCETAQRLLADGLPQQARSTIETIEALDPGSQDDEAPQALPCDTDVESFAVSRIAASADNLARATTLVSAGNWQAAQAAAQAALRLDRENAEASEVLAQAQLGAQAAELGEPEEPKTGPQQTQADWDSFYERYLTPLGAVAAPTLAVAGILVLLARLGVSTTPNWPVISAQRRRGVVVAGLLSTVGSSVVVGPAVAGVAASTDPVARPVPVWAWVTVVATTAATLVGLALVARGSRSMRWRLRTSNEKAARAADSALVITGSAAAIGLAMVLGPVDPPGNAAVVLGFGALLAVIGVGLLTLGLATRLRLAIQVRDAEGKDLTAAQGNVIALLAELGASPPQGLEVPRGTDVDILSGTIATTPEGRLAKAVSNLVMLVSGLTPWRAVVDEKSENVLSVLMTRNGRSVGSGVINRDALDLHLTVRTSESDDENRESDQRTVDLHRLAAAFVLVTLSRSHTGFDGLCGATDWRSVGLHYIATTDLRHQSEAEKRVLAEAVSLDPRNRLAQVAYYNALYRRATDATTLDAYQRWLNSLWSSLRFEESHDCATLRVRVAFTRAAVTINSHYAGGGAAPPALCRPISAVTDLATELDKLGEDDPFATRMRRAALGMLKLSLEPNLTDDPHNRIEAWGRLPSSPRSKYGDACHLAVQDVTDAGIAEEAVRLLKEAQALPAVSAWMQEDPQLTWLRDTAQYREAFLPQPRTDLLDVPPLDRYKATLTDLALTTADALVAHRAHLHRYVMASPPTLRSVQDVADLRLALSTSETLDEVAVEILHDLAKKGATSVSALRRLRDAEREEPLAQSLATSVTKRCHHGTTQDDLVVAIDGWLAAL